MWLCHSNKCSQCSSLENMKSKSTWLSVDRRMKRPWLHGVQVNSSIVGLVKTSSAKSWESIHQLVSSELKFPIDLNPHMNKIPYIGSLVFVQLCVNRLPSQMGCCFAHANSHPTSWINIDMSWSLVVSSYEIFARPRSSLKCWNLIIAKLERDKQLWSWTILTIGKGWGTFSIEAIDMWGIKRQLLDLVMGTRASRG